MTDIETNDDLHSFFAEMQDVKPIKPSNKALLHDTENAIAEKKRRAARQRSEREKLKSPLSLEGITPVKPDDFILFQQPGIQDGVFKKITHG